jgi:hypothetical protein
MMFLIGFEDEKTLRRHELAHEWNMMCHVVECPRSRFGFRSQAKREDHIASAHPEFDIMDVDVETTHSASCVQSYVTCQERERTEILCEVILSGDAELAAEFLDLDISFQGNFKGINLLDLAVQSKSVAMAKLVTDKLELKKSFLNGTKSVLEFSEEDVVNAFLWAVQLDCRDIITFFLESEFVSDLATRVIIPKDLELEKLVQTVKLANKIDMHTFINALVVSLIINGKNQFEFILSHNINVDGCIHCESFFWLSTTDMLIHWLSPNYAKLWSILCQFFENGADVNFRGCAKEALFLTALQRGWGDRNQVDAVNDLVRFGANLHEKLQSVGAQTCHPCTVPNTGAWS